MGTLLETAYSNYLTQVVSEITIEDFKKTVSDYIKTVIDFRNFFVIDD